MMGVTATALGVVGAGLLVRPAATAEKWDFKRYPRDHVIGPETAPVAVLEYSSLTCGHCAAFHAENLPKLKEIYIDTGKVQYIARDFPLDELALAASVFPHCAAKERYSGLLDVLFQSQSTWARSRDPLSELRKIGRLAGLSKENVDACLADRELVGDIQKRAKEGGDDYKINSTPTFIINGKKIVGNQPWAEFQKVIDEALAASAKG